MSEDRITPEHCREFLKWHNRILELERQQADLVRHIENLIECATHHQADIRTALDEARACIRSLK